MCNRSCYEQAHFCNMILNQNDMKNLIHKIFIVSVLFFLFAENANAQNKSDIINNSLTSEFSSGSSSQFQLLSAYFTAPDFNKVDGFITWNSTSKISWENFKAETCDEDEKFVCSSTDIICFYDDDGEMLNFRVYPVFNERESWVHEGAKTTLMLFWQQMNFDLTALYAYKLLDELNGREFKTRDSQKLNRIVENVKFSWYCKQLEMWEDIISDPDNISNQLKWARYISKELVNYCSTISDGYCAF